MNFDTVETLVASMGTMKYFPSDVTARIALVETMSDLTDDEEQVRWLVKRMRVLFADWPGERELRAVFCAKYRPKDGIEVSSSAFADGVPPERQQIAVKDKAELASRAQIKQLPPAEEVHSEDPELNAEVKAMALMNRHRARHFTAPITPEEIEAAPDWLKELEGYR